MNNTVSLGEKLTQLRQKFCLTQENIATYLQVDQSLISKIEKDERNIDSTMLEKLADLYLIQVDDLLNGNIDESFKVSFRKDTYEKEDLFALAQINRIVLNQQLMDELNEKDR